MRATMPHRCRVAGAAAAAVLALVAFTPPARGQSNAHRAKALSAYCRGTSGGSFTLSDRSTVVYAIRVSADSSGRDSLRLDAVFVARNLRGRNAHGGQRRPVALPAFAQHLTGASVDTLYLGLDRETDVAWIQTQQIPLHGANLILVDRVDGAGGPPTVVTLSHLPRAIALASGPCAAAGRSGAVIDAVRAAVLQSEDVRAFIAP